MRIFYVFLFWIFIPYSLCAQHSTPCADSLTEFKGYYVRIFEKKAIADREKNRKKRLDNRPFKVLIENEMSESFFLPVGTDGIDLRKELNSLFDKKYDAIYLYCSSANYSLFDAQFCNDSGRLKMDTCQGLNSNKYYTLNSSDKYCYQVFYLMGKWLKGIAITDVQKNVFRKQAKYLNSAIPAVNVYLLKEATSVHEMTVHSMKLWKEVPPLFQN